METNCINIKGRRSPKKEISTSVIVHAPPITNNEHNKGDGLTEHPNSRCAYPQRAKCTEQHAQKTTITVSGSKTSIATRARSLPNLEGEDNTNDVPHAMSCAPVVTMVHHAFKTPTCDPLPRICDCLKGRNPSPVEPAEPEYSTADEELPEIETESAKKKKSSGPKSNPCKKKTRNVDNNAVLVVSSRDSMHGDHFHEEPSTSHDSSLSTISSGSGRLPNVMTDRQVYVDGLMNGFSLYDSLSDLDTDLDSDVPAEALYLAFSYMGEMQEGVECCVCLEEKPLYLRYCCRAQICEVCLNNYCKFLVENGNIKFPCPDSKCNKPIYQDEVFTRLDNDCKMKLYRFLINANADPLKKTCPRCTEVTTLTSADISGSKVKRQGCKITCEKCDLDWCFVCQSPWHDKVSCKKNRKGDKLLKKWANEVNVGQVNARRCPHCKIFIQRKSGCDHMTCSKCGVNFCYRCGEQFRSLKFLGDHYSKFGIFGCKYRLMPNKPVLRKFVRGSIFGAELIVASILGGLALIAGAAVLAGAVIGSPILVGIGIRRYKKRKQLDHNIRDMREHDRQRTEEIRRQGDPYMENYSHLRQIGVDNLWKIHETSQHIEREIFTL